MNMKIAGMPVAHSPPAALGPPKTSRAPTSHAVPMPSGNNQVALTSHALESWGRKQVSWGRKHQGKTFEWTYNNDQGYVKWLLARKDSMTEDAEDFGNYSITRQRLESASLNSGQR